MGEFMMVQMVYFKNWLRLWVYCASFAEHFEFGMEPVCGELISYGIGCQEIDDVNYFVDIFNGGDGELALCGFDDRLDTAGNEAGNQISSNGRIVVGDDGKDCFVHYLTSLLCL